MKKTINDYKTYLDEIHTLSKALSKDQRKQLETILQVQLTLLVALKKSSHLGDIKFKWMYVKNK